MKNSTSILFAAWIISLMVMHQINVDSAQEKQVLSRQIWIRDSINIRNKAVHIKDSLTIVNAYAKFN